MDVSAAPRAASTTGMPRRWKSKDRTSIWKGIAVMRQHSSLIGIAALLLLLTALGGWGKKEDTKTPAPPKGAAASGSATTGGGATAQTPPAPRGPQAAPP